MTRITRSPVPDTPNRDQLTGRVLHRHLRAVSQDDGPRARLEDAAARVREIIHRVTQEPTFSPAALVSALHGVVGVLEAEEDDEGEADSRT